MITFIVCSLNPPSAPQATRDRKKARIEELNACRSTLEREQVQIRADIAATAARAEHATAQLQRLRAQVHSDPALAALWDTLHQLPHAVASQVLSGTPSSADVVAPAAAESAAPAPVSAPVAASTAPSGPFIAGPTSPWPQWNASSADEARDAVGSQMSLSSSSSLASGAGSAASPLPLSSPSSSSSSSSAAAAATTTTTGWTTPLAPVEAASCALSLPFSQCSARCIYSGPKSAAALAAAQHAPTGSDDELMLVILPRSAIMELLASAASVQQKAIIMAQA